METNSESRRYETRRSTRAKELIAKSRVDGSRTKRSRLLDSAEEDEEITSAKNIETSSEDEAEEKGGDSVETNSVSRRYETRSTRAKELIAKSRVDWSRTKRSGLLDSEEEDEEITSASEKVIETSSEDEAEEKGEPVIDGSKEEVRGSRSSLPIIEAVCDATAAEDMEEESIVPGKRKRSQLTVMYDSEGSDDSGIFRKVFAKRSCIIDEEDSSAEQVQHVSPEEAATKRKQERLTKLQELSRRRSAPARRGSDHQEDAEGDVVTLEDNCPSSISPTETINSSDDDDSMKDFIVEEEEGKEMGQEKSEDDESQPQKKKHAISSRSLLEHYVPFLSRADPYVHFQRIVRAFLINAVDDTFLISLYAGERQKKYAREMLTSLRYLDDRFIQPHLDNLFSRSRWKERYKERVESYPDVCIFGGTSKERVCEACALQRYCTRTVVLSGKSYNSKTMEIDDFMSHDEQSLLVGNVCGNRTQVYHNLKHFKYKLYQDCCFVMKKDGFQDEPLKDIVDRVFRKLDEDGWIRKHYTDLKRYTDDADYFQEEKMD